MTDREKCIVAGGDVESREIYELLRETGEPIRELLRETEVPILELLRLTDRPIGPGR